MTVIVLLSIMIDVAKDAPTILITGIYKYKTKAERSKMP